MTEQELEEQRQYYYNLLQEDDSQPAVQYLLALCYLDGYGTVPDRERGMLYLTEAAENDYAEAVERLKAEQTAEADSQAEEEKKAHREPLPPLDPYSLPLWLEQAAEENADPDTLVRVAAYSLSHKDICSPAESRDYLERAAEQHSAKALTAMGFYLLDRAIPSVEEDPDEEAFRCFKNASELGDIVAKHALADCCYTGRGVPQDEAQANYWRERQATAAMEENMPLYCLYAGLDFYHGVYTRRSVAKAIECFQRLKKSDDEWLSSLGEYFLTEYMWAQNPTAENALRILLPLADQGNKKAEEVLRTLYTADILPQLSERYHPPEEEEEEEEFSDAESDDEYDDSSDEYDDNPDDAYDDEYDDEYKIPYWEITQTWNNSGYHREFGKTGTAPWKTSLILHQLLLKMELPEISWENRNLWIGKADAGDADAQYKVACHGVEQGIKELPPEKCLRYLEAAAAQNHSAACRDLGLYILRKQLPWPEECLKKAFECFQKAAELGDCCGMCNLSIRYFIGSGTAKNEERATYWMEKTMDTAAKRNEAYWCEFAALSFYHGVNIPKSEEKAIKGYQLLQGFSEDSDRERGTFRLAEAQWMKKPTAKEALRLLLPLADQNNARAEQTLLILYEAGVLPQLKERYTGAGGEGKITRACLGIGFNFHQTTRYHFQNLCLTGGKVPKDFWDKIANACSFSQANRDPGSANLFLQTLLQPAAEGASPKTSGKEKVFQALFLLLAIFSPGLLFFFYILMPLFVFWLSMKLGLSFDNTVFAVIVYFGLITGLYKLINVPAQKGTETKSQKNNPKDQS